MKKSFFIILSFFFFFSTGVTAIDIGKWGFFVDENFCYIGSAPIKEEGEYTKRGDTYLIVYRINKNPEQIVQITSGYNYDENKPVSVLIDQASFEFFSKEDSAWTKDKDKEVIYAMKKGIKMIIKGYSFKGTLTTDTYTLKGFTTALKKLSKDC